MNPKKNCRSALVVVLVAFALVATACGSSDPADSGAAAPATATDDDAASTTTEPAEAEPAVVVNGGEPTSLAFASREFVVFGDGPLEMSPVAGDPSTGPSTFMLKVPANFGGFMHTHEASYTAVVVSGQVRHWHLGENPDDVEVLGAGGSWFQEAGVAHQEDNLADEETVVLITFEGPFDLAPHEDDADGEAAPDLDSNNEPTSLAFESREFIPFGDSPFEISVIEGDPAAGPSRFLLKMPANFDGLMHTHEASYRAVVVSGQVRHWHLGENLDDLETLSAGATWSQPSGVAHQEDNMSDETTILHITMDGPFDLAPHEGE